ncbi:MAG: DUF1499 domain-containing protein [Hyphomonadaceae bacterium]|nr:DUF1499 domain-containing protein [Hyphomonadaceae bacterium]
MTSAQKIRIWSLRLALGLAVFLPIYFASAALGSKFGIWDWRFGFKLMRSYGPNLLYISAFMSVMSLILAFVIKPRNGQGLSVFALTVPFLFMAYGQSVKMRAQSVPPIHDISTDTQDPPVFSSTIIDLRGTTSNSLNYVGKKVGKSDKIVSVEQVKAYPDIRTIESQLSPSESFKKALETVTGMGWKEQSRSESTGVIEATDTTSWFGFKDDVVIRIRPSEAGGSLVDIRSVSRVGMSDVGANAARIRKFTDKFNN